MTSNKEMKFSQPKMRKPKTHLSSPFELPHSPASWFPPRRTAKNHPCLAARHLVTSSQRMLVTTWKVDSAPALQLPYGRFLSSVSALSQHCNTLVWGLLVRFWEIKGRAATQLRMQTHTAPRNWIAKFPFLVLVGRVAPAITSKPGCNSVAIWPWYSHTTVVEKWLHVVQSEGLGNCLEWSKHTKETPCYLELSTFTCPTMFGCMI